MAHRLQTGPGRAGRGLGAIASENARTSASSSATVRPAGPALLTEAASPSGGQGGAGESCGSGARAGRRPRERRIIERICDTFLATRGTNASLLLITQPLPL